VLLSGQHPKSTKKADKTPQVKEIRALIGVVCLNRLNMGNIAPAFMARHNAAGSAIE
jgi:hypothetical protein